MRVNSRKNEIREAVWALVRENPDISISEIVARTGYCAATASNYRQELIGKKTGWKRKMSKSEAMIREILTSNPSATLNTVAKQVGVSVSYVSHVKGKMGMPKRISFQYVPMGEKTKKVKEYAEKYPHWTCQQIAKEAGCSVGAASIFRRKLGLKREPLEPTEHPSNAIIRQNPTMKTKELAALLGCSISQVYALKQKMLKAETRAQVAVRRSIGTADNQDDIVAAYKESQSVNSVAKRFGIDFTVIRKVLISNGILPDDRSREIHYYTDQGLTVQQIANRLGVSKKAVMAHMPYTRGTYVLGDKTENAKAIQGCRARKKAAKEDRTDASKQE